VELQSLELVVVEVVTTQSIQVVVQLDLAVEELEVEVYLPLQDKEQMEPLT
tara:strand:+ start:619 stop:771 length:153 start_codon:yes stop_codon:yes gene_type:complete